MEIRQLEYFVAVAEALSFTQAADRVNTVQSNLSTAIRALEGEVGVDLFDRSVRRSLKLTPQGEAFLPVARQTLHNFSRARQFAFDLAPGLRGNLRVGTLTSQQLVDLPRLFAAFRARYPMVDFQLRVSPTGSTGLAEAVRNNDLDVALVSLPMDLLHGLATHEICRIPFGLFMSPLHPLAKSSGVRMKDLIAEDFIETPPGFGSRIAVDQAFAQCLVTRRCAFEIPDLRVVADYLAQNLGIAIVPRLGFFSSPSVVEVPLIDLKLDWSLFVVHQTQPSNVVKAFLDLLPTFIADFGFGL